MGHGKFTAEVEREKIAERTMRGKVRHAREGRLVQGTGIGIYGYICIPQSRGGDGKRRIDPKEASIVRRMFTEFINGESFHAIAQRLNAEGIETKQGYGPAMWHPLTIRRILMNETYTGRTIYRRTRIEFYRDQLTGRKKRRVVQQPQE